VRSTWGGLKTGKAVTAADADAEERRLLKLLAQEESIDESTDSEEEDGYSVEVGSVRCGGSGSTWKKEHC
jgi:hypothetical protein